MSQYIMIQAWSGKDRENTKKKLGKVFRISDDAAANAMDQIDRGEPWIFDRTISDTQSQMAEAYLTELGFIVEISPTPFDETPTLVSEDPPEIDFAEETESTKVKKKKPKKMSHLIKVAVVLLIFVGAGYGLLKSGWLESVLGEKVAQVVKKEIDKTFDTNNEKPEPDPVPLKPLPKVKPLPTKSIPGSKEAEYKPMGIAGCELREDEMNLMLLKRDLYATQTDFCKGREVAYPAEDLDCQYRDSKSCKGKQSFTCNSRSYRCIPETSKISKAKFKKEVNRLERLENEAWAEISDDLNTFQGVRVQSAVRRGYKSGIQGGCYTFKELKDRLYQSDLKTTQNDFFCKNNTLANPVGGWECRLSSSECQNGKRSYGCYRGYQCIEETPDYNRAKFKKVLDDLNQKKG